MCLVQGGSGIPFLAPSLYEYISGKSLCNIEADIHEIPDSALRNKLDQVLYVHVCYMYAYNMYITLLYYYSSKMPKKIRMLGTLLWRFVTTS